MSLSPFRERNALENPICLDNVLKRQLFNSEVYE